MHARTTGLLLVLVLMLGVFVGLLEWGDRGEPPPPRPRPTALIEIEPERIAFWSFQRDGLYVECVNDHGQWRLRKPVEARADPVKMNHLLGILAGLPRLDSVTVGQYESRALDPADFGLREPAARMAFGNAARRYTLAVGGHTPMRDAVYAQLDHDPAILVTSTNLLDLIPRSADDLRDARLLAGAPASVRGLDLKVQGRPLVRVQREGGDWILRKPVTARADPARVAAVLDQLFALSAQQFVTERLADPSVYGLDDDEAFLVVQLWQNEEPGGLKMAFSARGDEQGDRMVAAVGGTGTVYAVRRDAVEALAVPLDSLRDPRLYFMNTDAAAWIRLEDGDQRLLLENYAETGWQVREPVQWKADDRAVADLLHRLNALRADGTLAATNLAALGLDPPARRVSVADGPPPGGAATPAGSGLSGRTLALGRQWPGREYVQARFEDEELVYQVSAAAVAALSLDPVQYRDSLVLNVAPEAVTRMTLRRGTVEQSIVRSDAGSWQPADPAAGPVRAAAVGALLEVLAGLRVLRFERPERGDLAVYGLKEPGASLTLSLNGQEGIQKTLLLGDESEDLGVYGMIQGQDVVFVLPRPAAETVRAGLWR